MKTNKLHTYWIVATLSIILIATYEGYWLHGLYQTKKTTLQTQITSILTMTEVQTYVTQIKQKNHPDSLVFKSLKGKSRVVSLKIKKTNPQKIKAIKVYKPEQLTPQTPANHHNIHTMDSLLTHELNQAGLHTLRHTLTPQQDNITTPPGQLQITSTLGNTICHIPTTDITTHILLSMWGIILTSLSIITIVILAFTFLIRSIKQQQELDEIKTNFTNNITHELKTPIAVAYTANDALLNYGMADNPHKRKEYLTDIKTQLEKLSALVERILTMSIRQNGNFRLDITETNLHEMLTNIARETKLRLNGQGQIQVQADPQLHASFDVKLITSVITTLVDNSIKYSHPPHKIQLHAFTDPHHHTNITVTDNGIGITPAHQKHIFEKYYRVPHGDIHQTRGYGLGLHFAKTIIQRHGGNITLQSTPGKGTTITIKL